MRKLAALVLACAAAGLSAQAKGPIVDRILIDAKTQEDIALRDVAAGRSDLFNYSTDGAAFKALPDDLRAKLDPYAVTGSNYVSLLVNPYPDKAPYTVATKEGKVFFNPFAIRALRYALNFLINRKKIVDEIMVGAGVPMYTPVTPGQPNSARFGFVAGKLGFTATGSEKRALADMDAAMNAAAALPENRGKLAKIGQWWTYGGQPVGVKFLIRVDDPNLRLPEGRYIADQIEKAGIKVERLEYDRTKCRAIWDKTDPKSYEWNLYTEAWSGGQTYAFWDGTIAQMYAPWSAGMPGGGRVGVWNYEQPEIDRLTKDCATGRVRNGKDYYDKLFKANELGIAEAVRIWIASQTVYVCANKDRFNSRMIYGLGDGINKFSMYSADVKPEPSGEKVFRVSEFSSRGDLFMSSWDPIAPDGFSDTYSQAVVAEMCDAEFNANPVTGIDFPMGATWSGMKTDIDFGPDGSMKGRIPVPPEAVIWNARTQKWESGTLYVDLKRDGTEYDYRKTGGITAWSAATYAFRFGAWHDGRPFDISDYRYAIARQYDLCVKKGAGDRVYDEGYAGSVNPGLARVKGFVFNRDGSITSYGDANYPMDKNQLAALLAPSLMIEASNYGSVVPWEIHEALKGLVAEGSASKTAYVFNSNGDLTDVDLISRKCVADIRAKLEEYVASRHVPASIAAWVGPERAVKDYKLAIDFIDKHGHAFISNGGFMLDSYDAANKTAVLAANRDPSYPFAKGYFASSLASSFIRIDAVNVGNYKRGSDLRVTTTLSQVAFPANSSKPATKAGVKVTLVADKESVYPGRLVKAGSFETSIPAAALDRLKPGSYTLVVEAALGPEAGEVETSNVIVF